MFYIYLGINLSHHLQLNAACKIRSINDLNHTGFN